MYSDGNESFSIRERLLPYKMPVKVPFTRSKTEHTPMLGKVGVGLPSFV